MRERDAVATEAVKLAVDLLHLPSQARTVRSGPLPNNMLVLLQIAAGDDELTTRAAKSAGRSTDIIRDAAAFFIEQILLHPDADSYRVLGVTPKATYSEIRRNMALLLRWLHPDGGFHDERAVFASRVTEAWENLKTKDRRAAYDLSLRKTKSHRSRSHRKRGTRLNERSPFERNAAIARAMPPPASRAFRYNSLLGRILMLLFRRFVS